MIPSSVIEAEILARSYALTWGYLYSMGLIALALLAFSVAVVVTYYRSKVDRIRRASVSVVVPPAHVFGLFESSTLELRYDVDALTGERGVTIQKRFPLRTLGDALRFREYECGAVWGRRTISGE